MKLPLAHQSPAIFDFNVSSNSKEHDVAGQLNKIHSLRDLPPPPASSSSGENGRRYMRPFRQRIGLRGRPAFHRHPARSALATVGPACRSVLIHAGQRQPRFPAKAPAPSDILTFAAVFLAVSSGSFNIPRQRASSAAAASIAAATLAASFHPLSREPPRINPAL